MVRCGQKRKADAIEASKTSPPDAKLLHVAHALANSTRTGELVARGNRERFPLPAITFQRGHELTLPLRPDDAATIQARAQPRRVARSDMVPTWSVEADVLELRNPRWHAFLTECVDSMRTTLGIAPAAVVELSLRHMVVADAGARLLVPSVHNQQEEEHERSVGGFGTLVVVLPGAFEGGNVVVGRPETRTQAIKRHEQEAADTTDAVTWRPSARACAYDLAYAAFYNHCSVRADPVVSGTAHCLVYDLVTSTPSEVPLCAPASVLQDAVNESLDRFFDVVPAPLAKRYKLSPDVRRTINELAAERHFVYLVEGTMFQELRDEERTIAQHLAAFCAQSGGQFVLYHAGALVSKGHGLWSCSSDENDAELNVRIKAPWVKCGEASASEFLDVSVHPLDEVAPVGRIDSLPLSLHRRADGVDFDILRRLHRNPRKTKACATHALVVQPASIELRQLAQQPMKHVLAQLTTLLAVSRDAALQFARRAVYHRFWYVHTAELEGFAAFLTIVITINDHRLFIDLLGKVALDCVDHVGALASALQHFGWHNCVETLTTRVLTSDTFRHRLNLIVSVVKNSTPSVCVAQLLDTLLSLHPWKPAKVDPYLIYSVREYEPDVDVFRHLLRLAQLLSHEKLIDVVTITQAEPMIHLVVPALKHLLLEQPVRAESWRSALAHVWTLFPAMMTELYNQPYANVFISQCCRLCSELKAFFVSTDTETQISYVGFAQHEHIEIVLAHETDGTSATVEIEAVGNGTLKLTKTRDLCVFSSARCDQLLVLAMEQQRVIPQLISQGRNASDS